jgi:hypothetical protein
VTRCYGGVAQKVSRGVVVFGWSSLMRFAPRNKFQCIA